MATTIDLRSSEELMSSDWITVKVYTLVGDQVFEGRISRKEKIFSLILEIARRKQWKPASIQLLHDNSIVPASRDDVFTQDPGQEALTFSCIVLHEPQHYDEEGFCDMSF